MTRFDSSVLDYRFKAAKAALLNRPDEFFVALEKALRVDEIKAFQVREWPLFEPMRSDDRFEKLLSSSEAEGADATSLTNEEATELIFGSKVAELIENDDHSLNLTISSTQEP